MQKPTDLTNLREDNEYASICEFPYIPNIKNKESDQIFGLTLVADAIMF